MKRIIAMILVLSLSACLCACGKKLTMEEAIAAPQLDLNAYQASLQENVAKTKAEYDKKVFKVTGMVIEIGAMDCTIGTFGAITDNKQLTVYLDEDVLIGLEKGNTYTFAGTFYATSNDWTIPYLKSAILINE